MTRELRSFETPHLRRVIVTAEDMGLLQEFVDTDAPIAREWAEGVYATVRADSDPLDDDRGPRA